MAANPTPPPPSPLAGPVLRLPRLPDGTAVPSGPGCYLLHAIDPATGRHARYHHAGHYTGHAQDVALRVAANLAGRGANLPKIMRRAGLALLPVRVWEGATLGFERALKRRGGAAQYCPACRAEQPQRRRGRLPAAQLASPASAAQTAPRLPKAARSFLRLNPTFARPVRQPRAVQWSRVRDREQAELLGPRVIGAWAGENDRLSQDRVRAVVRTARAAVAQRRDARAAAAAERAAERVRPGRLAAATRARLDRADARAAAASERTTKRTRPGRLAAATRARLDAPPAADMRMSTARSRSRAASTRPRIRRRDQREEAGRVR